MLGVSANEVSVSVNDTHNNYTAKQQVRPRHALLEVSALRNQTFLCDNSHVSRSPRRKAWPREAMCIVNNIKYTKQGRRQDFRGGVSASSRTQPRPPRGSLFAHACNIHARSS